MLGAIGFEAGQCRPGGKFRLIGGGREAGEAVIHPASPSGERVEAGLAASAGGQVLAADFVEFAIHVGAELSIAEMCCVSKCHWSITLHLSSNSFSARKSRAPMELGLTPSAAASS